MDRRHFMRAAALGGLSVFTPWIGARGAGESETFRPYDGPYWLMINLLGGWDTTMFCDPKGRGVEVKPGAPVNTWYDGDEIEDLGGGLRVAPGGYYGDFLTKYKRHLTIVNGVDAETNGHKQGVRVSWSGTLAHGFPTLGAAIAAERMRPHDLPMPFLTFGGYERTSGLVTPTRLSDTSLLTKVSAPSLARYDASGGVPFQAEHAAERAEELARARLTAMRAHAQLPRVSSSQDALFTARLNERNVARLLDELDLEQVARLPGRGKEFVRRQAAIALAAFKAGICVSGNLTLGGWDSHGNNDQNQRELMTSLFESLSIIMGWAADHGIQDKLNIVVASDFGRTPYANNNNGKNHWSVGSWMIIEGAKTDGPRVFGRTDAMMRGVPLNERAELAPDTGHIITPAHLHRALREEAGIGADSPIARQFDLGVPSIDLLGRRSF